jgi:hypothetical protein
MSEDQFWKKALAVCAVSGVAALGAWWLLSKSRSNGFGKKVFPDGSVFEGQLVNGIATGHGKLSLDETVSLYGMAASAEGEFKNDLFNGEVVIKFGNGVVFEGDIKSSYTDGKPFPGAFSCDFYANGKLYSPADNSLMVINGLFNEKGLPKDALVRASALDAPDGPVTFDGRMVNGAPQGLCKSLMPDGSLFFGEFENGIRNGKGKLELEDGSFYDGEWLDDKKNGAGVMQYKDGNCYSGTWVDGLWKDGVLKTRNGQKKIEGGKIVG